MSYFLPLSQDGELRERMAELAIVKAQRDALAQVVAKVWENARDGCEAEAYTIEAWMTDAGLAERYGDGMIRLTDLGRAARLV